MKKNVIFNFSVDDICLEGYSTEKHLNEILDFCDENKVKSTLFTVPVADGISLEKRPGYIKVLKDAVRRGHEVAQHGLEHDRFEIGIPPEMIMMLPHEGPARKFLAENRDKLALEHTVEKIRRKLKTGKDILEQCLGIEIKGFRAPAGQSCPNMYKVLVEDEYAYDSSEIFQKGGWDLLNDIDAPWQEFTLERFLSVQKGGSLLELPISADYVWYLKQDKYDKALALAIHDFSACLESGVPLTPVCHVSPIHEGDEGLGFKLYRELFDYMKDADCEIAAGTMSEACNKIKREKFLVK